MDVLAMLTGHGADSLANGLLKETLLLAVVWGGAVALRRRAASLRHLVWTVGIVALLGMPLVTAALPWRLPVLPAIGASASSARVEATSAVTARRAAVTGRGSASGNSISPRTASPLDLGGTAGAGSAAKTARSTSPDALAAGAHGANSTAGARPLGRNLVLALEALWALGTLLLLARLAVGGWVVRRTVREGRPLEEPEWRRPLVEVADRLGLEAVPALIMSDRLPMPFTAGALHPVIVLPGEAGAWSVQRRRAVLCHELAHLRRGDFLYNALGRIACAVYWFHPLVWVAAGRIRAEGERAADDMVLSVGTRPSEYADHLLQIVRRAGRSRTPAVALPMAQASEFEGRMLAILQPNARRDPTSRVHALVMVALATALVLPLAAMAPASQRGDGAERAPGPSEPPPVVEATGPVKSPERAPTEVPKVAVAKRLASDRAEPAQVSDSLETRLLGALSRALDDPSADVRVNAAYALGQRQSSRSVGPLSTRLGRDESAQVREMSAWALGEIESGDAIPALSKAATSDGDESVRATSVWALGQIGDASAAGSLARALSDGSAEVRARAAWALGTISPRTAPPELTKALGDAAPDVRKTAAWALGRIGDASSAGALAPILKDPVAGVRSMALWALGNLDSDQARTVLMGALDSSDPQVRAQAVRALAGGASEPRPWPWPQPRIR